MSLLMTLLLVFSAEANQPLDKEIKQWGLKAAERCAPGNAGTLYHNDLGWGLSFLDAANLYKKIYGSNKRLDKHIYFSGEESRFKGPSSVAGRDLNIPLQFLYSIKRHVEEALRLEYAQWIFLSDMGHNHFFIPKELHEKTAALPMGDRLEIMIGAPDLKLLYHTLEQIKVTEERSKIPFEDAWSQWRYYTRNIVGDNRGEGTLEVHKDLEDVYNTVRNYPDHAYWAGINLSANKDGCFSFEHGGQTTYFDVGFYDLPYSQDGSGDYF